MVVLFHYWGWTTMKYEEYREARVSGFTSAAMRASGLISRGMISKLERRLREDLSPEEYAPLMSDASRRAQHVRKVDLREGFSLASPMAELTTHEAGYAAEYYALYRLSRAGFEACRPGQPVGGTDILVVVDGKVLRCEVKSTRRESLEITVSRVKYEGVGKSFTTVGYEESGVDFFLLVDLIHENLFVVPYSELKTPAKFRLSAASDFWRFKDRFDLLGVAKRLKAPLS